MSEQIVLKFSRRAYGTLWGRINHYLFWKDGACSAPTRAQARMFLAAEADWKERERRHVDGMN